MIVHKHCDNLHKQQRQRGMLLSDIGLQKLENAKNLAEKLENKGDRFTLEELSERTQISIDTLARVFAGNRNVDKTTLKCCFRAFGLTLDAQDCYQPTHPLDLKDLLAGPASPEAQGYQTIEQPGTVISLSTVKASEFVPLELLKNYQPNNRQKRRRGVILSSQGRQKLQRAKAEVEYQEKGGNRLTLEELSGRTKISMDTLTKIFTGDNNVDKKTLSSCFLAFGLTLESEDYYQPSESVDLEVPGLPKVSLNSRFYVERPPIEAQCYQTITQPGSLIRIKGARGRGKTSLMYRILGYCQHLGYATVSLSLQLADRQIFQDPNQFFPWFCANISLKLKGEHQVAEHWHDLLGNKVNCQRYFEQYLLDPEQPPLVIAIDEVDRLFNYPELAKDFFACLRTFHEEAKNKIALQKLRFVISYATDVCIPLDLDQSAFNIGLSLELPELNCKEIIYLSNQYNLNWSTKEADQLLSWVGGNPYLVSLALYNIYCKKTTLAEIVSDQVASKSYIYREHLEQQLRYVQSQEFGFREVFTKVIKNQNLTERETTKALQLQGLGLINYQGNRTRLSCRLYAEYFRIYFNF